MSQLRVNAGTIRPPITAATPRRQPSPIGIATPSDCRCISRLAIASMAAIGGFLLTAIPNWTNRAPIAGTPLAVLTALWLIGRFVCLISAFIPGWLAPVADLAFAVALEAVAARELVAAGNRRNYPLLAP